MTKISDTRLKKAIEREDQREANISATRATSHVKVKVWLCERCGHRGAVPAESEPPEECPACNGGWANGNGY